MFESPPLPASIASHQNKKRGFDKHAGELDGRVE